MLKDKDKDIVVLRRRAEPMLVSLSNLYSIDEISVSGSRPSFSFAYIFYWLLFLAMKRVYDFGLRRLFYSKQDLKDACYSSA